ncbi:MAG TPA: hypothetical protein VI488_13165 [Candidatus Angelobacter sp.]
MPDTKSNNPKNRRKEGSGVLRATRAKTTAKPQTESRKPESGHSQAQADFGCFFHAVLAIIVGGKRLD